MSIQRNVLKVRCPGCGVAPGQFHMPGCRTVPEPLREQPPDSPFSMDDRRRRITVERVSRRGRRQWCATVGGYTNATWYGRTEEDAVEKARRFIEGQRAAEEMSAATRREIQL